MQTVVETKSFLSQATDAGMTERQRAEFVTEVAKNPELGDLIVGTGGCRKVRWAGRGKGKSGGFRVMTFYSGEDMPVYLLAVFGKGEKANFDAKERAAFAKVTKGIVEAHKRDRKIAKLRQIP